VLPGWIYTNLNKCAFLLLVNSSLTAVRSGRCALAERYERLLPRNLVLLDLLVLPLILLVGLLLVLGDQVVDVGSAVSSRDVPGRTSVEDPVAIMLARVSRHSSKHPAGYPGF